MAVRYWSKSHISKSQLAKFEAKLDKLFAKYDIDVEFSNHFHDRLNDARNKKQITIDELAELFNDTFKKYGKRIASMKDDDEAVLVDISSSINVPFVINIDKSGMEMVSKTIMRKKGFKTRTRRLVMNIYEITKSRYEGILEAANSQYASRLSLIEAEVIKLKPHLKAKKKKEQEEKEIIDFTKTRFGFKRAGYGREVAFVLNLPVAKSRVKKNMGSIVRDVNNFVADRFGKWLSRPSVGGMNDRAKAGMVTLNFNYDVDPMVAYGLGYDWHDRRTGDIAKNKREFEKRMKDGEKMKDDLLGFKDKARAEMKKLRVPEDDRDKMWKDNYMEKYKKLARKYEKKGFSVIAF